MRDITTLKGVGPKCAELLSHLHFLSVEDLLFHLPLRYEDRSKIHVIASVKPGDHVLVEGDIHDIQIVGARQYVRCTLSDNSGASIDLTFFYFTQGHQKRLLAMRGRVRCFGEIRRGFSGHLEIVHPEYAAVNQISEGSVLTLSPCLSPIYPTTKGLQQITLRKLMKQALEILQRENTLPELLPDTLLQQFNFLSLTKALEIVHFPPLDANPDILLQVKHPAQQRLIFEELLAHQLSLQQLRRETQKNQAIALPIQNQLASQFMSQLPFQLTGAQARVVSEIQQDLNQSKPMLRLVQGDVGSGKTVVSAIAALQAIEAGFQVALMVPTEILSEQHYHTFLSGFSPLGICVELLLGRQTASEQRDIKSRLASGDIHLIIGTHALFQQDVEFKNLALLIIDEQHRFGVHQRLSLMKKGLKTGFFPHQLIMTATPIPRTLAMTAYADLDFSVIDELPPGRKPILTTLISATRRDEVIDRVRANCELKKQAYWVCTLIDESEMLQCQAAETTAAQLREQLPTLQIGLIHGRLKSMEKNAVMEKFVSGEIDLLVATTVIEVGVDVANASLMIIENPERLGLSQLHQLRGRVGRGDAASFCALLYQHPLSEIAKQRLSVMRETQDGFVIAEQDLQMRGPGDVLGVRQSGLMQLRVADLIRDQHLLSIVQTVGQQLIKDHPELISKIAGRWVGAQAQYLAV
jgi:ATP-dependent DNA helicase RecG